MIWGFYWSEIVFSFVLEDFLMHQYGCVMWCALLCDLFECYGFLSSDIRTQQVDKVVCFCSLPAYMILCALFHLFIYFFKHSLWCYCLFFEACSSLCKMLSWSAQHLFYYLFLSGYFQMILLARCSDKSVGLLDWSRFANSFVGVIVL